MSRGSRGSVPAVARADHWFAPSFLAGAESLTMGLLERRIQILVIALQRTGLSPGVTAAETQPRHVRSVQSRWLAGLRQ